MRELPTPELLSQLDAHLYRVRYWQVERRVLDRAHRQLRKGCKPDTVVRGLREGKRELDKVVAGDYGTARLSWLFDAVAWTALVIGCIEATRDLPFTVALGITLLILGVVGTVVTALGRYEEPHAGWSDERPEHDGGWVFCDHDACPRPAAHDGYCLRHQPRTTLYDQEAS